MSEMPHGGRRALAIPTDEATLPVRFVALDRLAHWRSVSDAVVLFANGTEGDDTFTGTEADEVYRGRGGDDALSGGGGEDMLYGDGGDDRVDGGDDEDMVYGGGGSDQVYGGRGSDYAQGDAGDDLVFGQGGDDEIFGGSGHDRLEGGSGNDHVRGDGRGDILFGNKGDDYLYAAGSKVYGGAGDDRIRALDSRMHGGAGHDNLVAVKPFGENDGRAGAWGGSDTDLFIFVGRDELGGGLFTIHDLSDEERIDLSRLDADEGATGDQSFSLVPEFGGEAGQMTIRYDAEQDTTLIQLYTNTDTIVDGTIVLLGNHADFTNFVF